LSVEGKKDEREKKQCADVIDVFLRCKKKEEKERKDYQLTFFGLSRRKSNYFFCTNDEILFDINPVD
jgi:hypothetical protein